MGRCPDDLASQSPPRDLARYRAGGLCAASSRWHRVRNGVRPAHPSMAHGGAASHRHARSRCRENCRDVQRLAYHRGRHRGPYRGALVPAPEGHRTCLNRPDVAALLPSRWSWAMRNKIRLIACAMLALVGITPAFALDKMTVSVNPVSSALPYFIAVDRGYFKDA